MNFTKRFFTLVFSLTAIIGLSSIDADAQRRNERDIRDAMRNLAVRLDNFESTARFQMQSSSVSDQLVMQLSDEIRGVLSAMSSFQSNFDRKRENRSDAENIANAARRVDEFLKRYPQNMQVERDWLRVREMVDRLATNYGVVNRWNDEEPLQGVADWNDTPPLRTGNSTGMMVGITGTYDLDRERSDRIDAIIADADLDGAEAADLRTKLESPQQIAIDIRGQQITLATSNASPISFMADGRDRTETGPNGETIRIRASLSGGQLTIASRGGETDYTVIFTSENDGRIMKVSRRITTDYLSQTVFADSIYSKSDSVARLGIESGNVTSAYDPDGGYSDNDEQATPINGQSNTGQGNLPPTVRVKPGNYVIPNGTTVSVILDSEINTKVSQNNDRFRMTVQSPDEFRGAVVEGYISGIDRSGRVLGQPKLTFNFEKITLRSGQTYDFAGTLIDIRDTQGRTVKVDNEGTAKGDSQTRETVKRGGIGAGIGAVIGAIAGGAKGAAIGAAIGGGAGAGTVVLTGKEDVRLLPGSTITIQAAAPTNIGPR